MNFLYKFFLTASSPVEISQRNYLVLFFRQNSENESSLIDAFNRADTFRVRERRNPLLSANQHVDAFACVRRRTHGLCISAAGN